MSNTVGDVTEEQLKEEYGMTEDMAKKLLQDLPKLCEELAAPEKKPAEPGKYPYPAAPQDQTIPQMYFYPYPVMPNGTDTNPKDLPKHPRLDEATLDLFEKMTDEQIAGALDFVDRFLLTRDSHLRPEMGIRPGAMVGYRWPADSSSKALASFILFGTKATDESVQKRNDSFWDKVTKAREALDKKTATDSSAASILPPPFFYEDELHVDLDKAGIVIEDGVLKAPVSAAAAMVQEYTIDGKKVRVLKEPTELKAAADHARMIPITNDHPLQRIVTDPDEIMGWTGLITYDEKTEKLRTTIEVKDEKTIKDIQDGKDNVSIGFICDLDYTPGKFKDEDYDAVQKKIILNHLAVVNNGRCPTGLCGIGQDSKTATDSMTEEELIADAKKVGCLGGEDCKCGKHKSINIKDEGKEPEKKEGDAKMKYTLEKKDGHSHTAELDENGNGESSTDMEHKHKIEAKKVMDAGDPPHTHALEEEKAPEPDSEEKKDVGEPGGGEKKSEEEQKKDEIKGTDQSAKVHEQLLKEKMDAIAAIANEIATKGTTMKQDELQGKISAMQDIGWKLTELVGVIRAGKIAVPSDAIDAALKTMNDTKSIETTIAEIRSMHEVLLDEVMDFEPPSPREHFEAMDNVQLKEIIKLLDSQSIVKLPANDSSSAPNKGGNPKGISVTDAIQKKANAALGK